MSASTVTSPSPGRLRTYASFVRLEHTLFSLPLILAGMFSAPGPAMSAGRWLLVAFAAVGARTAAMSLNRLVDRHIDAVNPRTASRELPAGRMRLAEALALLLASTAAYLLACAALGPWYLRVSAIPLAVFALYPYLKRLTPFCHAGVGAALALSPLAGYAAAHPDLSHSGPALWLSAFALCWVSGFDIIYATLDETFDRAHGIHSAVVALGRAGAMRLSWALHAAAALALGAAGATMMGSAAARATDWGLLAGALYALTLALLYFEQRWAEDVNLAFFKINVWVGASVLALVLAARMAAGGLR
jgi:4-hydroxybenzoate polyprenyltransferase